MLPCYDWDVTFAALMFHAAVMFADAVETELLSLQFVTESAVPAITRGGLKCNTTHNAIHYVCY